MGLVSEAKSGSKTGIICIAELCLTLIYIVKKEIFIVIYHVDPFTELSIVPAGIFEAGYISTRLQ